MNDTMLSVIGAVAGTFALLIQIRREWIEYRARKTIRRLKTLMVPRRLT